MTKHQLRHSVLFVAINSILITTSAIAAEADTAKILAEETITLEDTVVNATAKTYTVDETNGATGLDLEFIETPQSTTVVTKDHIKDQQLSNITDLANTAPSISVQSLDGGRNKIFARGFEVENINVDGMPVSYQSLWGEGAELGSVSIYEQVEIVKGANGLTSGAGQPSASINLQRKRADSSDFTGEISAGYDNFGTYEVQLDTSSKLNASGTLRARTVIDYADGDIYVDREQESRKTAYGVVDADIGEDTTVSIGAMHQEKLQKGSMFGGLPFMYTDGSKIDWDVNQSSSVNWGKRDGITDEVFASLKHDFNDDWKLSVDANHAKTEGDSKLFYINGFVMPNSSISYLEPFNGMVISGVDPNTGMPLPAKPDMTIWQTDTVDTNFAAEISGKVDMAGKEHQVMIGTEYNDFESATTARRGTSEVPVLGIVDKWDGSYAEPEWGAKYYPDDYSIKEYSVYGSTRLQLAEPLSVILGSRLSNHYVKGSISKNQYDIEHEEIFTPFVGVTYKLSNNSAAFASYTDTFKPQQWQNEKGDFLKPVTGKNLEIGIKGSNDNETLNAQFSVFNIEQDNLAQVNPGKFVNGDKKKQAYIAAEGATSKGVEAEINGNLSEGWKLSAGYTHFTAKDVNDKPVSTNHPDTSLKLFTSYNFCDTLPKLTIGAGVNWNNGFYTQIPNPLENFQLTTLKQKPVTVVNLMANYKINDNLDVQINADNVLDEHYASSHEWGQLIQAEPRNISGKLTFNW